MSYTGYDPTTEPVDAVRMLVGDTTAPFQLEDIEIAFALDQTSNVFRAAAICARTLASRYARRVDTRFETVESKYSQMREGYERLARSLDAQAKTNGGLGTPLAGGITVSDVETADNDANRVKPYFKDGMFHNPPPPND